jgi:1-acyl-sn-glycerol-3-phosphate acyltransferase
LREWRLGEYHMRPMHLIGFARLAWRTLGFIVAVVYDAWRYLRDVRGVSPEHIRAARARWLHGCCRRVLPVLGIHLTVRGPLPKSGLIVAHHLSYMDIGALAAALPCVFVSKMEVADWPIFGVFGKYSGTLFLDRGRRRAVHGVAQQMREVLGARLPLVMFPEATSTNGDTVLPFKTSLFEPVTELGCPVTPAVLSYTLSDGSVRDEVHWWGRMTLMPHLLNLMRKRRIDVTIRFGEPRPRTGDRKSIAQELHAEVVTLRTAP